MVSDVFGIEPKPLLGHDDHYEYRLFLMEPIPDNNDVDNEDALFEATFQDDISSPTKWVLSTSPKISELDSDPDDVEPSSSASIVYHLPRAFFVLREIGSVPLLFCGMQIGFLERRPLPHPIDRSSINSDMSNKSTEVDSNDETDEDTRHYTQYPASTWSTTGLPIALKMNPDTTFSAGIYVPVSVLMGNQDVKPQRRAGEICR